MKSVAYHRLAASELIKSAEFYERRVPYLGETFLFTVEQLLPRIQRHPELGKPASLALGAGKQSVFPFELFIWNNQTVFGSWRWRT